MKGKVQKGIGIITPGEYSLLFKIRIKNSLRKIQNKKKMT